MQPRITGKLCQLVEIDAQLLPGDRLPLARQKEQVASALDVAQAKSNVSGLISRRLCLGQGFDQLRQRCNPALHIPIQLLKQHPVRFRNQQAFFDLALLPQQGIGRLQTRLHILNFPPQPVELGEILLPYCHAAANGNGVKLGIAVPQQRMRHVHAQPIPDRGRYGRRAA